MSETKGWTASVRSVSSCLTSSEYCFFLFGALNLSQGRVSIFQLWWRLISGKLRVTVSESFGAGVTRRYDLREMAAAIAA